MKNFNYYKPLINLKFAKSLWYDKTSDNEKFYHLISFKLRKKHKGNAIQIVFFGVSFIFTRLFFSDFIDNCIKE